MVNDNIAQHIDLAYSYLSKIPVSGEAVDLMALARQELKAAYSLTKDTGEEDGDG